jgi:hypothetical protein
VRRRTDACTALKMPSHRRKKKASTAAADFRDNNVGRSLTINEYAGWRVPASNTKIDIVNVSSITPEQFWAEYVSQRKPVRATVVDLVSEDQDKPNSDLPCKLVIISKMKPAIPS